jgi:hypothetical protein
MDISPTRKKSLKHFIKGGLEALDIEIDDLDWHPIIKDLAHNVVESLDKTANNALLDKKILSRAFQEPGILKREPEESETIDSIVEAATNQPEEGGF